MGLRRAAVRAAWGMSETASCVTLGEIPEDGWSGVFVPVGRPIPGIELRIVDDAGQPVDDSVQGHLQIRGRAVSTTYRGRPDLSGAAVTPDGWFVTGDLGFISDGVLTITGREKDLVIVNGVNYSCREIEAALDRSAALNPLTTTVIALRRPASATDEVVAFVEPRGGWLDVDAVRRRTFEASGVRIDQFVHVDAGQIPRTSTAKRQRSVLADRFLAGEYDDRVIVSSKEQVSKSPSTTSELCRIAGDVLGIADVGPDDDFFGAGGDSVAAVRFVVAANDAGYELDLTSLFRHSVLRELEQTASSKRATAV
jgi:myxalamid-type polyketide synthase MxaB